MRLESDSLGSLSAPGTLGPGTGFLSVLWMATLKGVFTSILPAWPLLATTSATVIHLFPAPTNPLPGAATGSLLVWLFFRGTKLKC